jgi:hemerythrin-like domain-containing protein
VACGFAPGGVSSGRRAGRAAKGPGTGEREAMNRPDDLISVMTEDHRELRQLYTELEFLSGGESLRRTLTDQLIVEMVRHSVAEESYLYPVTRKCVPDGAQSTDEAYADHQHLEKMLRRLEEPGLSDDQFSLLLSMLIPDARRHIDDEEQRIFPLLVEYVSEERLISLGQHAKNAKAKAPSRPVPGSPNLPLLHVLLQTGTGLVERVRGHLCGRGKAYPDPPVR